MPDASTVDTRPTDRPLEYAVAVWIGMPDDEIEKGLREGWIRGPAIPPGSFDGGGAMEISSPLGTRPSTTSLQSDPQSDRGRIHALLLRLDRALDESMFDAAWNEAGDSDASRAHAFTEVLTRMLNVPAAAASNGLASPFAALEAAAVGASGEARFRRLDGMTGVELERIARSDGSLRRALAQHDAWAMTGDRGLAQLGDPHGHYDRYDRDTGEALLSDAWLGDRARHAAWRMAAANGQPVDVAGDGWRFVDRAAGASVTVEVKGEEERAVHQVIFARDDGDRVNGGVSTDRIHGGRGDDLLRGRAGDDLIEGGAGSDALQGGSGRDQLLGQQGDDELDGGAGGDRLDGGSGDDELAGGRGDDVLRGGDGNDVYRFEQGDGSDTIEDDGGAILIDDVPIAGTMLRDDALWQSADGRYRLSLEGDVVSGGTLTIRAAQADDREQVEAIRVLDWRPGAYGISLGEETAEAEDAQEPPGDEQEAAQEREDEVEPLAANDSDVAVPLPFSDSGDNDNDNDNDNDTGYDAAGSSGIAAFESTTSRYDVSSALPFDLSFLAPGPLDEAPLVNAAAVAHAIDDWSIPAPPDIDAAIQVGAFGVTSVDFVDGLADGADAVDSDGGIPVPFDLRTGFDSQRLMDLGSIVRPEPLLRQTSLSASVGSQ